MTQQLEATKTPTRAIVAAVLVGVAFVLAIAWPLAIPAAIVGLVLAHRSRDTTARGLWLATVIVGYIALAVSTVWGVVMIVDMLNLS